MAGAIAFERTSRKASPDVKGRVSSVNLFRYDKDSLDLSR